MTTTQYGQLAGTLNANKIPVTTADKSPTELFLFKTKQDKCSKITQLATETKVKTRAL